MMMHSSYAPSNLLEVHTVVGLGSSNTQVRQDSKDSRTLEELIPIPSFLVRLRERYGEAEHYGLQSTYDCEEGGMSG